ncbi:MAG: efflux RND transporter permease subunit, partial [Proteobacteria bacterium]|nr:efflux RND transporter permease subunit [Pseudomonadota bacterium]
AVKAFVDKERKIAPPGISLVLSKDVFSVVRDRLKLLFTNGGQGFVLAIMVLWFFFSFRFAFWVAMGLPISFLGSLYFMQLFGYSLNMLTTLGLLISIGLIMDDAIVIAENIATKISKGASALEAAVQGTEEVGMGVLSSFVTTVCMFLPLSFLEGTIGKIIQVMPLVLIITLAVSLVEAFLILPSHMAHSLEHTDPSASNRFRTAFERGFEW